MASLFDIQTQSDWLKDGEISGFSRRNEEGAYLPKEVPERAVLASPIKKSRIYFLFFLISFLIFIILIRVSWLQIIKGDNYRQIAESNRVRTIFLKADRGLIYDRNLTPLVKNKPNFSLTVIPGDLPKESQKREEILNYLLSFFKKNVISEQKFLEIEKEIRKIFQTLSLNSYQETEILKNLDYQLALRLDLKLNELPGFYLKIRPERDYPYGSTLGHIIGYLGRLSAEDLQAKPNYLMDDFIGKTGLESYYEDLLKGKDGQRKIEVNFLGREERTVSQQSPTTGKDLILSLDLNLQKKVEEVLNKYLKIAKSQAGSIIVLSPSNGEVLAIYSWPSYDNNLFIQGDPKNYLQDASQPLFFRAVSGEYPSGSVIKPVIAAAGLAERIIDEKTTVLSKGGIKVGQWFFADWKAGGHGETNITKALAESVNTFFYYLGGGYGSFKGLGPEKINYYARLFGLNELTGIDLPGENKGLLATPEWKQKEKGENWYIGDTYHLSIGQGDVLVTPIQVANYTAAIANGGTLFQPHLVKKFNNPENNYAEEIKPKIIRSNFIDPSYLDVVKKGLRLAVTEGSARRLNSLKIKVAGKTGTAQVGGNKSSHAWFSGFAPYESPEIVVTVLIENGGEGSSVAVPAAEEIFKAYFHLP